MLTFNRFVCAAGAAVALACFLVTALAQSASFTIEINQAIGVQFRGHLKFVAGKDTVVRALMAAPVTVDPATTSATVTRDSVLVATLAPNTYSAPTAFVDFQCPTRAACGSWAAGSYVFEVKVNGETRNTADTTYAFVERAKLRVLALPVKTNYDGTILSVTDSSWKSLWQFTRDVYPIAHDGIVWTTRDELDASEFNIETNEGQLQIWQALANLNPAHCAANKNAAGCYDKILGFIPQRYNVFPNGRGQGYTFGSPANIIVASDEDAAATVAHEIAHNYEIGDAYDGGSFNCTANPTPDSFSGTDFHTQAPIRCTAGRVPLAGVSGTLVPAPHHPYDVGRRGPLGNVAEYMGSGGLQAQFWTSQDAYDWIFDRIPPGAARRSSTTHIIPTSVLPRPGVGRAVSERLIEFFGYLKRNASSSADVRVGPWEAFIDDEDPIVDTKGPLMVAAVNAAGVRLAATAFTVKFDLPGGKGEPAQHLAEAPFEGVVRFPPDTARFQIISGNRVLREIRVTPNAPVVSNVSLGALGTVSGERQIVWNASDADGDAITYTVEYNPDITDPEGDYFILFADMSQARWTENFDDLPGGDHAKIRIVASDGINTGFAETPEFRVPFKAPFVEIDPLPQPVYAVGSSVTLSGTAEDLQEELPDSSLVWTSDRSGFLGAGEVITLTNLAGGRQIVTLTATNSRRLSTSASIRVEGGGVIKKVSVSPAQPAPGQPATVTVEGVNPCGAVGLRYDGGQLVVHPSLVPYSEVRTFTAGTHTILATGHGNCLGSATLTFTVR